MRDWLRTRLRGILDRLESRTGPVNRRESESELAFLRQQLETIEQDRTTLDAMLSEQKDSFHHSIASGTTVHAESIDERKARELARIEVLERELAAGEAPRSQ